MAPESPMGLPAPYWLIVVLKVLGFTLHMIPMHIWLAGIPLAMIWRRWGGEGARRASDRLMAQMPVVVAMGINFGIVPLLFLQVAYYRVYYPATVLMAWFWFGIIVLLLPAYYGVYAYASALKEGTMPRWRLWAGWVAAALFIAIGFLFVNGLSLMVRLDAWPALWQSQSVAGAPLGLALNVGDATLWPRWLLMFGLSLTTVAAWLVFDTAILGAGADAEVRRWRDHAATVVSTVGAVWFAIAGTWYVFGTWPADMRQELITGPAAPLMAAPALVPLAVWLLVVWSRRGRTRAMAWAIAIGQFAALAVNAISRQLVQNRELAPYIDVASGPVQPQWTPLAAFVLLLVAGLIVVAWILRQAQIAMRQPA
jgi:hypothetical protein